MVVGEEEEGGIEKHPIARASGRGVGTPAAARVSFPLLHARPECLMQRTTLRVQLLGRKSRTDTLSHPTPAFPPTHSTPYVTGTSVLGLIYKDGIMLASDTLGESVVCVRERVESSFLFFSFI